MQVHVIGGFTQRDVPSTGVVELRERLAKVMPAGVAVSPFLLWNQSWRSYARSLSGSVRHVVVGYSYGAGHGAKRLAAEMAYRDLAIDQLYVIDPVIRLFSVALVLNVISLTRLGHYVCPPNVAECYSFRQVNDRPPGRSVVPAAGAKTIVHNEVVFGRPGRLKQLADRFHHKPHPLMPTGLGDRVLDWHIGHNTIDNSPIVHEAIHRGIAEYVVRLEASDG